MRLCLVTAYDLSRDAGVNRHVLGLRRALEELGEEAWVLGPASGRVPARCIGLPGVLGVRSHGSVAHLGLGIAPWTTLAAVRRYRFELLHLHAALLPGPARQLAAHSDLPMVSTFHSACDEESWLWRQARSLTRWPLRRVREGIAVSRAARAHASLIYRGPLRIIPSGIVGDDFLPGRAQPQRLGALRILFVGRFDEPRKGLAVLLHAAAALRAQRHNVEVSVVGPGNPRRFLGLARAAGANFMGRLEQAPLAQAYRDADVFCAPSLANESFGMVLTEAMAARCPVVASALAGYAEAAQGAAALVPPGDVEALATTLWEVLTQRDRRRTLVECGARRAADLDWRQLGRLVRGVYARALGESSRAWERPQRRRA